MAWTQSQLTALEDAIAKGVREVKYRDKVIVYRSLKEMFTLRNEMKKSLGLTCKDGRKLISTSKGLNC